MTETAQQTLDQIATTIKRARDPHNHPPDDCPACGVDYDEPSLPDHLTKSCEVAA